MISSTIFVPKLAASYPHLRCCIDDGVAETVVQGAHWTVVQGAHQLHNQACACSPFFDWVFDKYSQHCVATGQMFSDAMYCTKHHMHVDLCPISYTSLT